MERLSVILPAYNERGNIAPLLEEIAAVAANLPCPTEVIIVDDGRLTALSLKQNKLPQLYLRLWTQLFWFG